MEAALGELTGSPAGHLRGCPGCRRLVKEWRDDCREINRMRAPRKRRGHLFLAAAAVLLIVAVGVGWRLTHPDPARLLAKAYTDARPFEFRLPDDGYAPVRQQRGAGSAFDKPESLAKAELAIRQLQSASPNPRVLLLSGRMDLMENNFEPAIDSLSRALEARPDDPEVLSDLGTAYAERGEAEKRNIDLGHASELFLKALRKNPSDQRVLFNLALVYEKLWLVDEAADTWRKMMALNPPAGWREEAHGHLKGIEQIREQKRKADAAIVSDPAQFLATHAAGTQFDPLPWFDAFWIEWLPKSAHDASARQAAQLVAGAIARQFHDSSFAESIGHAEVVGELASLMRANRQGHAEIAIASAPETARQLDAAGLTGAALLARIEFAYAARFAAKFSECVEATEQVLRVAEPKYPWLAGSAHLEHVSWIDRLGQPGPAREEAERDRVRMERAGIWPVALRAASFVSGIDAKTENYSRIWDSVPGQLHIYWSSPAVIYRIQGAVTFLEKAAELPGWRETAAALYRAEIRYADQAGNGEIAVSDRTGLAKLLEGTGHFDEEMQELNQVSSYLASQTGPVAENLRWDADLQRVEARIAAGHAEEAIPAIDQLAAHSQGRAAELSGAHRSGARAGAGGFGRVADCGRGVRARRCAQRA